VHDFTKQRKKRPSWKTQIRTYNFDFWKILTFVIVSSLLVAFTVLAQEDMDAVELIGYLVALLSSIGGRAEDFMAMNESSDQI
jgi:tryptophan-rich sensory protein